MCLPRTAQFSEDQEQHELVLLGKRNCCIIPDPQIPVEGLALLESRTPWRYLISPAHAADASTWRHGTLIGHRPEP